MDFVEGEVDFDEGRGLLQVFQELDRHLFILFYLVVRNVQLLQHLVVLEGPQELLKAVLFNQISLQIQNLQIRIHVHQQLLQVLARLVVQLAVGKAEFLQSLVLPQSLNHVLESLASYGVVVQHEFLDHKIGRRKGT